MSMYLYLLVHPTMSISICPHIQLPLKVGVVRDHAQVGIARLKSNACYRFKLLRPRGCRTDRQHFRFPTNDSVDPPGARAPAGATSVAPVGASILTGARAPAKVPIRYRTRPAAARASRAARAIPSSTPTLRSCSHSCSSQSLCVVNTSGLWQGVG